MKSSRKTENTTAAKPPAMTLTRRSLVEWMGKAAVFGLSHNFASTLLTGCLTDKQILNGSEIDGDVTDSDSSDSSEDGSCGKKDTLAFEPGLGESDIFKNWGERTVDKQDLIEMMAKWRLQIDGLVETPLELDFIELIELPRQDQVTDFHCVEGWSVYDVPWNGVHLQTLFERVKPLLSATHVTFHTFGDKYNESLPIDVARENKTMLAYGIDCSTLPLKHGFPARLVVPRKYGYKNPKFVYRIELTDKPINGYWVAFGYPYDGDVPDSRLRPGKY